MQLTFDTIFRDTEGNITRVERRSLKDVEKAAARLTAAAKAATRNIKVPGSRGSAVEYALWLAARDGVDVSECKNSHAIKVDTVRVERAFGPAVQHAQAVHFGSVTIKIPHAGYDATLPAVEQDDFALPLAA